MSSRILVLFCLGAAACSCNGDDDPVPADPGGDADADADADTDTDVLPDPEATLTTGVPVACAPTSRTGMDWFLRKAVPAAPDTDTLLPTEPWVWGSGVVVADFDADGLIDVFTANESSPSIYRNTGVGLDDVGNAVFDGVDLELTSGGSTADYDGDGDLDLLITRYQRPNILMENLGDGQFQDATAASGIPSDARRSMSSAWGDYDRDGDLDLYIGNYGFVDETVLSSEFEPGEPDWLLMNDGDGTFTDLSHLLPAEAHDGFAYAVAWIDLDDDLYPELYIVNDFGTTYPNALLWNEAGTLVFDTANAAGLNAAWTGMGLDFADLNADGLPDLVSPVWNGIKLLESFPTGSGAVWVESQASRTLSNDLPRDQKVGWGGDFGDVDNDGDDDILIQYGWVDVGNGEEFPNPERQPDALYLMDENGDYADAAVALGLDDDGIGRGGVFADFNNDGFLDVVKRDVGGASIAYLSKCDANAWLRIRPIAPWSMNYNAIGAKIRVTAGGKVQTNWLRAGGLSLASSGPPEVHFGFGAVDAVDRLEIFWPDGRVSIFEDVATRQILDVEQHAPAL